MTCSSTSSAPVGSDLDSEMVEGVRRGDRRMLAKVLTLLESQLPAHRVRADSMLDALLAHTGRSIRVGISGPPGAGKSTFIERLGLTLIERGHRVAVLAVDPSSGISGGSILGDKTRMERLSMSDSAFIRPSPAGLTLGGVAERTRESMLACEAAGHDVVLVETVGVGQSEMAVAGMTDVFVLLQLPNAGDDLQAMKKGVLELADVILINKSDLDEAASVRAEAQIASTMHMLRRDPDDRSPFVMRISAATGAGIGKFLDQLLESHAARRASGELDARRQHQAANWMWDIIQSRILADFRNHPAVREAMPEVLQTLRAGRLRPSVAARRLLSLFEQDHDAAL